MPNIRLRVAQVFSTNLANDLLGKTINTSLFVLIFANVVAIVLESEAALETKYYAWFHFFDVFSVIIFTIEYFARLWSCVDLPNTIDNKSAFKIRLKYMFTPMAIVDLLAILPFYLSMFLALDLRFLRVLRLLRIFKLTRYSAAMRILTSVLKEEMPALVAAYFIMFTIIVLASSGIYLLEHKVQPEEFGSIPSAMWWAVTTLTTVGYGDVTPITSAGKVFGGIITLVGISMVALPTGIIASGFGNTFRRNRQKYEHEVEQAFADGILTTNDQDKLCEMQSTLGISDGDAKPIYLEALHHRFKGLPVKCPKCGVELLKKNEDEQYRS
ncbi:MAG: ion transporter [Alteromonadaceae bacterium]|nr:ion transporter [Alteromonadaceae bacterium]